MMRRIARIAALALGLSAASVASAQAPIAVTPGSQPQAVAAQLKSRPAGQRTIVLTGFADDIASRDRITVRTSNPSQPRARATSVVVPSPWIDSGVGAVQSRVRTWMSGLLSRGASIDAVFVTPPATVRADALASRSFPHVKNLATDPRFKALAGRHPALAAATSPGAITATAWSAAIRAEVASQALAALQRGVAACYPAASVRTWDSSLVPSTPAPSASPTPNPAAPVAPASTSPVPASPAAAPSAPASTAASTASTSQSAAARAVASASEAFIRQRSTPGLGPWGGSLANAPNEWDAVFGAAGSSADVRRILEASVQAAPSVMAAGPACWRRATSFSAIPEAMLDRLSLSCGANRDARALAMHDCTQADFVRRPLLSLAIAARHGGDRAYLARCEEVLREVASWDPFQRPGWSIGGPSSVLPAGGDGVNMATAWGMCGVVDAMEVLGDRLPADLRASLRASLIRELGYVVDSWSQCRPWYVKSSTTVSNQWIDPSVAAIRACLMLRDDSLRPVYEMAVQNLAMSLGSLQPDGAFLEGVTYAQMSLPSLFAAVESMAANGDDRLRQHPFVQGAWKWLLQVQMPGGNLVTACDSRMAVLPSWATRAPLDSIAYAAMASGDPAAIPAVSALFPECGTWPAAGRYAVARRGTQAAPLSALPLHAYFPSQQLVTWREAWSQPGAARSELALWLKGGSVRENSHGQRDQGHLSVYVGSEPILLERGTPDYADPDYLTGFASARGHGTLQLDPIEPPNRAVDAPMVVERLVDSGGRVTIDLRATSASVRSCTRTIEWSAVGSVTIEDSMVPFTRIPAGTECYRFHLGCATAPAVERVGDEWIVSWDRATFRVRADRDILIAVSPVSNVLCAPFIHHALSIRVSAESMALSMQSKLEVRR